MSDLSKNCVACEGADLFDFFSVDRVPVNVGSLAASAQEARRATCGSMSLTFCRDCGLVHNRSFDPSLIAFQPGYDASLAHSPSMRSAINATAERLIEQFGLDGRRVFEIGCGQAHLLRAICEKCTVHATGVDPTATQRAITLGSSQLQLLNEYFSERHREHLGDCVLCVSVIEDIPNPLQFMRMLRGMIGDRDISIYFELFNGFQAITAGDAWSPHYEQCNYFSHQSVCQLFQLAGFDVTNSGLLKQNEQYLFVEARAAEQSRHVSLDRDCGEAAIRGFERSVRTSVTDWKSRLSHWEQENKRVILWGSGGKATSFLSMVPKANTIQAVVDINVNRQGQYMPLSAKPVISVEQLVRLNPDIIIVSNPAYRTEIEQDVARLGLDCQLHVA